MEVMTDMCGYPQHIVFYCIPTRKALFHGVKILSIYYEVVKSQQNGKQTNAIASLDYRIWPDHGVGIIRRHVLDN